MLGGPLAMTLLDTQRSWVGLSLLTAELAQWQPGLSCAPGEGTHLSLEKGAPTQNKTQAGPVS